jgi:CDP-diacylglycerol--glycerol-3-phosphate 3-phosphatidyltransferase
MNGEIKEGSEITSLNFPNTLSVLRIVLSPVFAILFLSGSVLSAQVSLLVFTVAALTDWYDGWYARKYGFRTRWGRFLDPLADKILTSTALICFLLLKHQDARFFGDVQMLRLEILVAIIVARDIVLTAVRSYKELKGREFSTSLISKAKTLIQMTYIFVFIFFFVVNVSGGSGFLNNLSEAFLYTNLNYYILMLVALLTVASGVAYIFESRPRAGKLSGA